MKILVPLDDSDVSRSILPAVRKMLARTPDAEVHFVSVVDPGLVHSMRAGNLAAPGGANALQLLTTPPPRLVENDLQAQERIKHEHVEAIHEAWHAQVPMAQRPEVHVVWSEDAGEAIVGLADQIDADVIAMATHGRTGLRHVLVGSVTEKVIRESGRPVLVVGPPRKH